MRWCVTKPLLRIPSARPTVPIHNPELDNPSHRPIFTNILHQFQPAFATNLRRQSQPTTHNIHNIQSHQPLITQQEYSPILRSILQCRISTCCLFVFIAAALALAGGVSYLRGKQDESQLPLLLITNQPNPAPFPYFHLLFRCVPTTQVGRSHFQISTVLASLNRYSYK